MDDVLTIGNDGDVRVEEGDVWVEGLAFDWGGQSVEEVAV